MGAGGDKIFTDVPLHVLSGLSIASGSTCSREVFARCLLPSPTVNMALVNDHVTDASEKKLGGEGPGGAAVARSTGSAHGHVKGGDLDFITKNNAIDSEYQL